MAVYYILTDGANNYPESAFLLISKYEESLLHKEMEGTLGTIVDFDTVGCDMSIPSNIIVSATNITDEARFIKDSLVQGRLCSRCKSLLLPSFSEEYEYQCLHHDEDLYGVETVCGEYTPIAFQRLLSDIYKRQDSSEFIEELKLMPSKEEHNR